MTSYLPPRSTRVPQTAEQTLVQAAQDHDRRAAAELTRRYEPLIGRIVRRLRLPDGCDREDIAQEARIGLLSAIRHWQPERGPFAAYAERCAANQAVKAIDSYAALKHRPLNKALPLDAPVVGAPGEEWSTWHDLLPARPTAANDPELALLTRELLDNVIGALPALSAKERSTLVGALNGRSHRELAAADGSSVWASKRALRRARARLSSGALASLRAA